VVMLIAKSNLPMYHKTKVWEPGEQGCSPNKIIGEQLVHPAPPIFSVTYS